MPNPDLMGLVQSVHATAEAALGEFTATGARARGDGLLNTPERARATAERSLRLLVMLAEKTRGNLDFEEADLLTRAIAELRERLDDFPRGAGPA